MSKKISSPIDQLSSEIRDSLISEKSLTPKYRYTPSPEAMPLIKA